MDESISAAEANRQFSRLLRAVREGKSFVVTSHGRPVARLVPPEDDAELRAARTALFAHLEEALQRAPAEPIGRWSRDELYEDEP